MTPSFKTIGDPLPSIGPRSAPPFVGREDQLGWLVRCLDAAVDGRPQVALVVGEAGIGKSRLVRELQAVALARDVEVATGRGYEDLTVPFLPFVEALAPPLRTMPAALTRALGPDAEIVRRLVQTGSPGPAPAGDQVRLLLAVSRTVIELARLRPTLFVLDDLHWVDQASLELFAHLVFAVADAAGQERLPLLVVASTRPVEQAESVARVVTRFQREQICQTLELTGLAEPGTTALIHGLGLTRASHQLIEVVAEATRGNPLFIQEVVHHLVKQGSLEERGGYLVTTAAPLEMRLPTDVTGALADRLRELDEPSRTLLTWAAVLGDPFSLDTLGRVASLDQATLLPLLDDAVGRRLLAHDDHGFRFAHPLVRHALYVGLPVTRRQQLHAQIADVLTALYTDRSDEHVLELAHHLVAAGPSADPARVVEVARRAGDRAFASVSFRDATRFYQAALAAAGRGPLLSERERAQLHYQTGLAHFRDQDVGPCLDHYDRAIAGFRACDDIGGLGRALMGRTRARFTLASVPYGTLIDPGPLRQVAERAAKENPVLCGFIWAELAQVFWTASRPEKAQDMARRALAIARQQGDDVLAAEAHRALSLACGQSLQIIEALANLDEGLACARRAGDAWLESHVLQRTPLVLTWLGRLDEAEAVAASAGALTRRLHDWGDHSLAQGALVCVAVARGEFEAAEDHARQVMMMRRRSGYPWAGPTALPALAYARALRGAWAEADDALAVLAEPGQVFEDPGAGLQVSSFLLRHLVEVWANPSGSAAELLKERLSQMPNLGDVGGTDVYALGTFAAVIEIAEVVGAPELVEAPYEILSLAVDRGVVFTSGWICLVTRVLGVGATQLRLWDRAAAWFTTAVEQAKARRARPELARAWLGHAQMLVARGRRSDRRRAVDFLTRATHVFEELGMTPFLRIATALAETLKAPLPRVRTRRSARAGALTKRDVAMLQQLARGADNRAIAQAMVLKPETAARQVRHLLERIGAHTRAGALTYALEQGLVEPEQLPGVPQARAQPIVVILFTDMEGSTSLFERLGDQQGREVLRAHDKTVREWLDRCEGTEVKHTGDGVMASFASVGRALECAIGMQRGFAAYNAQHPERPLGVRMGINAGEPLAEDGELFGTAVNAAARICAHAEPGQVLVSDVVRHLAQGGDVAFVDRGRVALRGFKRRFRLFAVPW